MRWQIAFRLVCATVCVGLLASAAVAAERPHFVRRTTGKIAGTGSFQTASVAYTSPKSRTKVVLCAVVHVAEVAYFQKLQKRLSASDIVLYEAVSVGDSEHPVPAKDRWLDPASAVGSLLGLVHQASSLDYRAKNFVWADLSIDEVFKGGSADFLDSLMGSVPAATGEALAKGITNLLWSALDPRAARGELAGVLTTAFDDLPTLLGAKLSHSLIALRNARCLAVLDERLAQLPGGTITVLYGAGHMPELDRTLQERGWTPAATSWYDAWTY